ncbi:natterin-like protein [Gracilaria domingensis]|nr:natterin-like protein [Gracilaria domingensis]
MVLVPCTVPLNYFTSNLASGGKGGNSFSEIKEENGAVLRKIEAWKQDWRIRGVRVTFSDGSVFTAGKASGSYGGSFTISSDEYITRLNIQPSGSTSSGGYYRLGAIWIKTSKGRDWGIFSSYLAGGTQHWVEVGSGLCCGIFGKHGADVDCLGFAMLRPVIDADIVEVTYPNLDLQTVASDPTYVTRDSLDNRGGTSPIYRTLEISEIVTKTNEWTTSFNTEFGVEVSVTAGIPFVGDVTGTTHWTVGYSSSRSMSETKTSSVKQSWNISANPSEMVVAEGRVYSDQITNPFKGTMRLTLNNGERYEYDLTGEYEGANYLRSDFTSKTVD